MNNNLNISVRSLDINYIFSAVEHVCAIILVIIVAKVLLNKPGLVSKKLKNIIWILIGLWTLAVVAQSATYLYNYYHATRPFYVQTQRSTTGL